MHPGKIPACSLRSLSPSDNKTRWNTRQSFRFAKFSKLANQTREALITLFLELSGCGHCDTVLKVPFPRASEEKNNNYRALRKTGRIFHYPVAEKEGNKILKKNKRAVQNKRVERRFLLLRTNHITSGETLPLAHRSKRAPRHSFQGCLSYLPHRRGREHVRLSTSGWGLLKHIALHGCFTAVLPSCSSSAVVYPSFSRGFARRWKTLSSTSHVTPSVFMSTVLPRFWLTSLSARRGDLLLFFLLGSGNGGSSFRRKASRRLRLCEISRDSKEARYNTKSRR